MAEGEGSVCLVCLLPLEVLLVSAVGALRCGHVYHPNCVAKWFALPGHGNQPNGCPQCKATNRMDDVRTLDFDVKQVPPQCSEELLRLEAATLEERERHRQELATEKAEVVAMQGEVDSNLAQLKATVQDHNRAHREAEKKNGELQKKHLKLSAQLLEETTSCAALQAGLDAEIVRLQCKKRPPPPCESDSDLRQERRKLRSGCRPADRARQLHEGLTSALQQEREKMRDKNQREEVLKKLEEELRDVRQLEAQRWAEFEAQQSLGSSPILLQTFSKNSAESASILTSSTHHTTVASSGKAAVVGGNSGRPEAACGGLTQRKLVTDGSTPPNGTALPLDDDAEDANMLYGHVRSCRTVSRAPVGFSTMAAPPICSSTVRGGGSIAAKPGGKWGALFGGSARRRLPVVQQSK